MRIAQVAPLTEAVPPKLYGGTERVVHWLTEELVALGHDVTLFASGDSQTSAKLDATWPRALRLDGAVRDANALHYAAHNFQGLVGTFSEAARQTCRLLEGMGKAGEMDGAAAACATLEGQVERLKPALRRTPGPPNSKAHFWTLPPASFTFKVRYECGLIHSIFATVPLMLIVL